MLCKRGREVKGKRGKGREKRRKKRERNEDDDGGEMRMPYLILVVCEF
jgi:hypothetical protein